MLLTLFNLVNTIPEEEWKLLFETYLFEEFMMNALAGRNFNFNHVDNSSILKIKSLEEIESRLNLNLPKIDAEMLSVRKKLACKLPDIMEMIPKVKTLYPKMHVVVTVRDAIGTLNSVLERGWFGEKGSKASLIWPFREYGAIRVPYWVRSTDSAYWTGLSELDKAAYYYIVMSEGIEKIADRIQISYRELIATPYAKVEKIADTLGLKMSPKTSEIISSIKPTYRDRNLKILDEINSDLRKKVKIYSESFE